MLIPSSKDAGAAPVRDEIAAGPSANAGEVEEPGVIFICKYKGCSRQYASTDGVRKHCRKSHPEWLREVDMEKAALGCRWAAYCTRHVVDEAADDTRTTPVGIKRVREDTVAGNAQQHKVAFRASDLAKTSSFSSDTSTKTEVGPREAFGDRGTLVPPQPRSARYASENMVPPGMVAVPNEGSATPLPETSKLTPNAQARQRLGEFADHEGCVASVPKDGGFFAWNMPPLKRGLSLSDTRDAAILASGGSSVLQEANDDEVQAPPSRNESFLDSIIA